MTKFLDRDHPFFRKPWVRAVTVVFPAVWSVVEFSFGNPGWAMIFAAAAVWAAWELFLRR